MSSSNQPITQTSSAGLSTSVAPTPLIELRKVSKQFQSVQSHAGSTDDKLTVLHDVSLKLVAGDSLAIVGPSGSGKSTLLHLMGALDQATSGEVLIAGQSLAPLSENGRAKLRNQQIGFVFQDHHLLPQCPVIENVLLPALAGGTISPATYERASLLLEQVGLAARASHLPAQLSGGERQRAAIARALLLSPPILLCDEPTGNLDADTAQRIVELLFHLHEATPSVLVLVTHAEELARRAKQICRLKSGTIQLETTSR